MEKDVKFQTKDFLNWTVLKDSMTYIGTKVILLPILKGNKEWVDHRHKI